MLVVSLDSVSLPWLERLMDEGKLPVLSSLSRQAERLPMASAKLAGVPYASLYTGLTPAQHGNYFPYQWSAEHQRVRGWHHLPRPKAVLQRLDEAGRRVVSIDSPEMMPITLKHGVAISGWQFRARVILHEWTSSTGTVASLTRRFGGPERGDEVFGQPTPAGLLELRRVLRAAPLRLEQAMETLVGSDMPDLLSVTFPALHIGSHQFFDLRLLDESRLGAEETVQLSTALEDVAVAYDRVLGRALERLPAGTDVLVFYTKGMGATTGWADLFPEMLRRVLGGGPEWNPVSHVRGILPREWRTKAAYLLPDELAVDLTSRLSTPRADWSRTRAFALPSDGPGFIRVNLRGRERLGVVQPPEMLGLLAEIEDGLHTFTDFDGEPCVQEFLSPADLFGPGEKIGDFPDRVLNWASKPTNGGKGVRSARYGEIPRPTIGLGRAGGHCEGTMAMVRPGRSRFQRPNVVEPFDIAATILSALGVPHADMPGTPFLI